MGIGLEGGGNEDTQTVTHIRERVRLNSGNDDLRDEKEGRVYVHVLYLLSRSEI